MRENIKIFLLIIVLQCNIVPVYAKCAYGIKREEWAAGTTEEQFIEDGWLGGDDAKYIQCEGPGDPFAYCDKGSRVLGADGYIYECGNKKWIQIPHEDIPTCTEPLGVLNDTKTDNWVDASEKNFPYTFFWDTEYFMKLKTVCKYDTASYNNQFEECKLNGGDFLPTVHATSKIKEPVTCDMSQVENMHIFVTDTANNRLSGVSFELPDLTADDGTPYQYGTAADNEGEYLIPTNPNNFFDITISKPGYISQTMRINALANNQTVVLQSEGETVEEPYDANTDTDADTNTDTDTDTNTDTPTTGAIDFAQQAQNISIPNKTNTQSQQNKSERLAQATENYNKAKENEQSLANRALTTASTAATGLGLMTAASAYSEKRADEAAEQDMSAYLATFRCEYGKGQSVKAGNEEITLPGGNELLEYYSEYKNLADGLKETKKALGMRPGIEQEVVYDKAESGLYKYASTGITDGAFTSLSRALTDTEGKDAAEWAEQKGKTSKNLKIGLIAAGAGVVGGVVGNYLINKDVKYQELKQEMQQAINTAQQEHPDVIEPTPQPTPPQQQEEEKEEEEVEQPQRIEPINIPTTAESIEAAPIQLTSVAIATPKLDLGDFSIKSAGFDSGKTTLNNAGRLALETLVRQVHMKLAMSEQFKDRIISIKVTGHTDSTGISAATQKREGYKNNQELSEKRAQSVVEYMKASILSGLGERVTYADPVGEGDKWCQENNKPKNSEECRRVDVVIEDITPAAQ